MSTFERQPWRVRHTCRLCGNPNPRTVLVLAATPPANAFCRSREEALAQAKYPLYLARCMCCGHVQLPVVVDPEVLFRDYVYVSGTSPSFREHFSKYAYSLMKYIARKQDGGNDLVIDVGSNDGTLLRCFKDFGVSRVLGVDPARQIAARATAEGVDTLPTFFDRQLARHIRCTRGTAALVTANNVFAHADDLSEIALGAKDLLDPERGRFVFEVQYLVDLVEGCLFDMVYHEHLSYHHVSPLAPFFKRLGMSLVDVERVPTHGGSIRCTVRPGEHEPSTSVIELTELEREVLADPWPAMGKRVREAGAELTLLLHDLLGEDKRVVGYGAPAKMATLCHAFGVNSDWIEYVVDDNPWKHGLHCPGTGIPVRAGLGEEIDVVVVFAWNFAEQVAGKLRAAGFTGKIYAPLPALREL